MSEAYPAARPDPGARHLFYPDPMHPSCLRAFSIAAFGALAACKGEPDDTPWCSAGRTDPAPSTAPLTYHRDIQPILQQKCAACHEQGGIAGFPVLTYEEAFPRRGAIRAAVASRHMPPWLAARCCTSYFQDFSLTDDEYAAVLGWIDQGGPGGDPAEAPPPRPAIGGLSRIDVTVTMAEPYTPEPRSGTTDDVRCFVADWPMDEPVYITGLRPVPGAREVVHHLVVAAVLPDSVDEVMARDGADGRPGFDCQGGFGDLDWRDVRVLGGSLLGGDFPRGIGAKVEPGSKIVLNIHYSTAKATAADQTKVEMRIDASAQEAKGIALANPAWMVGGAMSIDAGEKDAVFFYRLEPDLFTGDDAVDLQSITPHMHYFGSKIVVRALHEDGSKSCLLEIPRWEFGWEQPFWLSEPKRLGPDDELYIECHFDNSAENQPDGKPPRDIAWGGGNQDMCAAFLSFTEAK
jgi:hypothetical protein